MIRRNFLKVDARRTPTWTQIRPGMYLDPLGEEIKRKTDRRSVEKRVKETGLPTLREFSKSEDQANTSRRTDPDGNSIIPLLFSLSFIISPKVSVKRVVHGPQD